MEQVPDQKPPSFFTRYKFTLISIIILVLAIIPLVVLSQQTKKAPTTPQSATTQAASPTPLPLTQQNAQPTLDATDQQVQTSLNQVDTDLNAVNQINSSSDTTAGL